jgi:hypothetical protein
MEESAATQQNAEPAVSVFDDIVREDMAVPLPVETQFAYLNRSARPEAARVRKLVDEWFAEYPESHRKALVGRFRSPIDDEHRSAFFELFLHHLALARGCKVLAIEPKLEHTDKSPDFLLESASGERFYLEAVMATGRSTQETAAHARLNTALAAIDATPSPHHFLDLTVRGMPTAPLSIKKMKRALQSWIAGLPKDEKAKDAPAFQYEEHGATIRLRAWTRNKPAGDDARAIGVRHFPITQIAPSQEVRGGLKKKASRYGKLDHPYLVAINALGHHQQEGAVIDALLGMPYVSISKSASGEEIVEERRKPDGIWYGPPDGQAQNTGLSGVLAFRQIDPWNFASRTGLLVPNSWAAKPLPATSFGTDEFKLVGQAYERTNGEPVSALLKLPAAWPEEELGEV